MRGRSHIGWFGAVSTAGAGSVLCLLSLLCAPNAGAQPGSPQATPSPTERIRRARDYYNLALPDSAIQMLSPLIRTESLTGEDLLDAQQYLARSYVAVGADAKAEDLFLEILYANPTWRPDPAKVPQEEIDVFDRALKRFQADVVPLPPDSLGALSTADGGVSLSWRDNAKNETGVEVERGDAGTPSFSLVARLDSNAETYKDTGVQAGHAYVYRVRSVGRKGPSSYSREASVWVPEGFRRRWAWSVFAGLNIGELFGPGVDDARSSAEALGGSLEQNGIVGGLAGLRAEYPLSPSISIQVEAAWAASGGGVTTTVSSAAQKESIRFYSLQFPLLVGIRPRSQGWTPRLYAGPSLALLLASAAKVESGGSSSEGEFDGTRGLEVAAAAGAEFPTFRAAGCRVGVDLRFEMGLSSRLDKEHPDTRERTVALTLVWHRVGAHEQ